MNFEDIKVGAEYYVKGSCGAVKVICKIEEIDRKLVSVTQGSLPAFACDLLPEHFVGEYDKYDAARKLRELVYEDENFSALNTAAKDKWLRCANKLKAEGWKP